MVALIGVIFGGHVTLELVILTLVLITIRLWATATRPLLHSALWNFTGCSWVLMPVDISLSSNLQLQAPQEI